MMFLWTIGCVFEYSNLLHYWGCILTCWQGIRLTRGSKWQSHPKGVFLAVKMLHWAANTGIEPLRARDNILNYIYILSFVETNAKYSTRNSRGCLQMDPWNQLLSNSFSLKQTILVDSTGYFGPFHVSAPLTGTAVWADPGSGLRDSSGLGEAWKKWKKITLNNESHFFWQGNLQLKGPLRYWFMKPIGVSIKPTVFFLAGTSHDEINNHLKSSLNPKISINVRCETCLDGEIVSVKHGKTHVFEWDG